MAKIHINNPKQVINGGAKKYYFKVKGLGGSKGDKGDKGDTGSQGPQGPQGNAATISVGSTTTLPVGYDATVENVGSIYNAVLNFGIPQGPRGPQGATGAKGDKGDKGDQGNPGPQGEKGTNATVTVGTTTTTEPGTQAYAWNSSSNPNNAVINFDIPRGATGPQGPQGAQGPTGPAGADGKSFTPVVVSSLPSTGTDGKLYLTPKNYTTGTATGNPITISLGEDAGQVDSFQLDGDTYQQSYSGKNIIDYVDNLISSGDGITNTINNDGAITTVGKPNSDYNKIIEYYDLTPYLEDGATYTLSSTLYDGKIAAQVRQIKISDSSNYNYDTLSSAKTFTVDKSQYTYRMGIITNTMAAWGDESLTITKGYQLEKSASATTFEPYVGGVPSPSPSYPQDINVVTGTQTVSINGTNYPLDLGSIELCKLGTYQDYIYKDGDSWKVHNAIAKIIFNGTEKWQKNANNHRTEFNHNNLVDATYASAAISDNFIYWPNTSGSIGGSLPNNQFGFPANRENIDFRYDTIPPESGGDLIWKAYLAEHNITVYTAKTASATTDTVITDTTLIAQLEAIRTASLQASNTITNTATAPNLAGDMEIGYYEYDPTNRYDKWLWLDLNNNYEKLGS